MSPRTRTGIAAAPLLVRQLWATDPAAAALYVANTRHYAELKASLATSGDAPAGSSEVAASLRLAADAAAHALTELEATP